MIDLRAFSAAQTSRDDLASWDCAARMVRACAAPTSKEIIADMPDNFVSVSCDSHEWDDQKMQWHTNYTCTALLNGKDFSVRGVDLPETLLRLWFAANDYPSFLSNKEPFEYNTPFKKEEEVMRRSDEEIIADIKAFRKIIPPTPVAGREESDAE